jgi:hypothetical protein
VTHEPALDFAAELEPVRVLVIDDQDGNSVWDQRFADDAHRRVVSRRPTRFKRYDQVCSTAAQARTAVDMIVADDAPVDLILIDNRLQVSVRSYRTQPEAVKLMCHIGKAYRRKPDLELPACVLATAEPDVLLSHAFVQAGGHHSLARNVATPLLLEDLWRVVERQDRWRYVPEEPVLELTAAQRRVLPYFHADLATHEIVRRMTQAGELEPGKKPDWVHQRTSEIYERANDLVDRINRDRPESPISRFVAGEQRRVAQFALERGNIWLDLRYRDILDEHCRR